MSGDEASVVPLRSGRIDDNYKALGLAVGLFMTEPNFARLPFGEWSRILAGQIKRKHYLLVLEGEDLKGFIGWALSDYEHAERWVAGNGELSFEQSQAGDYIVVNAWVAKDARTQSYLVDQMRRLGQGKTAYYFKRFYKDGHVRPVRLPVGQFAERHIARGTKAPATPNRP